MEALQPQILAVTSNGLVNEKRILDECMRLARELEQVVKRQPGALIALADGGTLKGSLVGSPLDIRFRRDKRLASCSGRQQGWKVSVNLGDGCNWADIVEMIVHEICHAFRPYTEIHSPEFWNLLDEAMQDAYGVRVPVYAPPGKGQYWRDWKACYDLGEKYAWGKVQPFKGVVAPTVFHR